MLEGTSRLSQETQSFSNKKTLAKRSVPKSPDTSKQKTLLVKSPKREQRPLVSKSPERMSSLGLRGSELRTRSEPILRGKHDMTVI